ncbi:MAG: hypothetical protein V4700_02585 [Pseudomonadota bacterium]
MQSKIIVGCLVAYFMSSIAYANCPKAEDIKVRCPEQQKRCVFYATGGWQQAQLWSTYSNRDDNLVSKIKQEIADKKLTFVLAKAKSDNLGMQLDGCKYIVNWKGPEDGPAPAIDSIYLQLLPSKKRSVKLEGDHWKVNKNEHDCLGKQVADCPFILTQ